MIKKKYTKGTIFIHHFVFCIWQGWLIQKCEVWIDSFRGVKYKLQPMQICTRVGPLTADFFANYDLWITICWQMGHSVTDMQEKRETSCAPHKHPALGGFQWGQEKCLFSWHSRPHPPKYIAHLWGNIDSLLYEEWGGKKGATYDLTEKGFAVIFDLGFDLSLSNRSGGRIASLNWTDLAPGSNCAL